MIDTAHSGSTVFAGAGRLKRMRARMVNPRLMVAYKVISYSSSEALPSYERASLNLRTGSVVWPRLAREEASASAQNL